LFIDGSMDPDEGPDGTPIIDDDFFVLLNAWWGPLTFTVPDDLRNRRWDIACDSFDPARKITASQELTVGPRSVVVLQSSSQRLGNP
jgi:glycogen operon protein